MTKRILFLVMVTLGLAIHLPAQVAVTSYDPTRYVLVDGKLLRGFVGVTSMNLHHTNDTLPNRKAVALDLRTEVRIISAFIKPQHKFVVHDAFYLDLAFGKLTSDPFTQTISGKNEQESSFSMMANFGYDILAGYRTEEFGILAGKRFQWSAFFLGDTHAPSVDGSDLLLYTAPWMIRGEYHINPFSGECRIIAVAWSNFQSLKSSSGFRLDIPLARAKRFWLSFQYEKMSALLSTYSAAYPNKNLTGELSQFSIGLRVGSIY